MQEHQRQKPMNLDDLREGLEQNAAPAESW
jgi:hypothetical protein